MLWLIPQTGKLSDTRDDHTHIQKMYSTTGFIWMCLWLSHQALMTDEVSVCVFLTDIDECSQSIGNLCAFQCVNVAGSYRCACPPHGYSISANGHACRGEAWVSIQYLYSAQLNSSVHSFMILITLQYAITCLFASHSKDTPKLTLIVPARKTLNSLQTFLCFLCV